MLLPAPALRSTSSWFSGQVRAALLGAIIALLLGCASSPAAAPVPAESKPETSVFKTGVAVDRDLPLGAKDEVPLDLKAGQYLRLFFDGGGLDLTASLLGPGGEEIAKIRGAKGHLSRITTVGGAYRLVVSSPDAKTAGRYQVTLQNLGPAQAGDEERVIADDAIWAARRFQREKNYDQAVQQAQEALRLWRKVQDQDGVFEALQEVGNGYQNSASEQAVGWYKQALEQARASGSLPNQAEVLTTLGKALAPQNAAGAHPYFEAALPMWRTLGDSYQQCWVLYYLAVEQAHGGGFDQAIRLYQEALSFASSAADIAPDLWNGLGNAYLSQGESQKALESFQKGLLLAEQTGKAGAKAALLTGLGTVHRRRGEPQKALAKFQEAEHIDRGDPDLDRAYTGKVLLLIGAIDLDFGKTQEALDKYQQAIEAFRRAGDVVGVATAFSSIGQFNLVLGQDQEALERFREALKILEGKEAPRVRGNVLHGTGVALLKLKRVPEAVQFLNQALPYREKTDRLSVALTHQKLGEAYQGLGDLGKAEDSYDEALKIAIDVQAPFYQAPIELDFAILERQRGDLQAALRHIKQAIKILETVRSDIASDDLRMSFFASRRAYYDFYVDLLMDLDYQYPGQGYADAALAACETGRARGLLDLLAQGRLELTHGIPSELRSEEEEGRARLLQVQTDLMNVRAKASSSASSLITSLETQLKEFEERQREIEQRIKAESPRYYEVRYPAPLDRESIQKLVQPDEALLEYSLGEDRAYLFVVTAEGLKVHQLKLSPREITDAVGKIQKTLESPEQPSSLFRHKAYELYQALVAPAMDEIGDKRRLLIAPDGALHYLSFDVLLTQQTADEGNLPYLVRRFSVSYVPSASVLSSLSSLRAPGSTAESPMRFLAFAPDYPPPEQEQAQDVGPAGVRGDPRRTILPALVGAQQEVREIASRYQPNEVKLYLGHEASKKNIAKAPLIADRIHFAGHGSLDEEHPEDSALAMADGDLRVSEIFNLDLKSDLVVLAACKTAGKAVTGEGLVGLTRAFLYAGAPSVAVTLWEVADSTTSDLMVGFYKNLDLTGDKSESLRQSKLAMIEKKGRPSFPYYWAPFILVGKPR